MIRIKDLTFTYQQDGFTLSIPSLELAKGERTAIIGPSGSGKSTFLQLLSGILVAQKGGVWVDNININELNDKQRRSFRLSQIGFVFQNFQLVEYLNVIDNVLNPFRINPSLRINKKDREKANDLLQMMNLQDKTGRYPSQLSQGEQQRVAICRALVTKPGYILADEPTGNLDPENKERILDLLFEVSKKEKASLITVTHDLNLVDRFDTVINFSNFLEP